MKVEQRDQLLVRLDERVANIWRLTEKQEEHLTKINDALTKHAVQIERNRGNIRWIIKIGSVLLGGGGSAAGILKLLGFY